MCLLEQGTRESSHRLISYSSHYQKVNQNHDRNANRRKYYRCYSRKVLNHYHSHTHTPGKKQLDKSRIHHKGLYYWTH